MKTNPFDDYDAERLAAFRAAQTPGTPEHTREAALQAAHNARVAETVAAVVAAGGVIGVTHTDKGEPIAAAAPDGDEDEDEDEDADADTDENADTDD